MVVGVGSGGRVGGKGRKGGQGVRVERWAVTSAADATAKEVISTGPQELTRPMSHIEKFGPTDDSGECTSRTDLGCGGMLHNRGTSKLRTAQLWEILQHIEGDAAFRVETPRPPSLTEHAFWCSGTVDRAVLHNAATDTGFRSAQMHRGSRA